MQDLGLAALEDLFGCAFSAAEVKKLVLTDVVPLIDHLAQQEPEPDVDSIIPPSVDKLQKNSLSQDAMQLLKIGRVKEHLVSNYFSNTGKIEIGESIAEAFRRRYSDLKDQGHHPDLIFGYLQQYAGGGSRDPREQAAGLAVLSYFFERCDIFEDPGTQP